MPSRKPQAPVDEADVDVESFPKIKLSSGREVSLDGDLVFLIDALYHEFAQKHGFAPEFGDVQRELARIIEHMPSAQRHEYFLQSLLLNYVTYENEMAKRLEEAITKQVAKGKKARK